MVGKIFQVAHKTDGDGHALRLVSDIQRTKLGKSLLSRAGHEEWLQRPRGKMHSRDVIKELKKDGWYEVNQVGSQKQFQHATKEGRVTVPHPNRDIPTGTLKSIEKQAGIQLR
jgi:predicted RNA binding protein YcfA (HicA-like mRNA interferase family)